MYSSWLLVLALAGCAQAYPDMAGSCEGVFSGAHVRLRDVGMKRGDIQMLGTLSYAAPLLSTLVLVATGQAKASPMLGLAALAITGGAALAARASRKAPIV
jgi:hypothetical protein